jgi:Low affinity iron permease
VLVVVSWVPTLWVLPSVDTWQLVINTVTTIITFLLVALLQNTQSRADKAVQQKLNTVADALCWHARRGSRGDLQRARLALHPALLPGNAWSPRYLGCAESSAGAPCETRFRAEGQTDGHRRIRWPSARKSLSATS